MADEGSKQLVKLELKRIGLSDLLSIDPMIGSATIFKAIGPQETQRLLTVASMRRYPAGGAIFKEGDTGNALHLVLRGEVGLVRVQGKETVPVCTLTKGEFFGEPEALGPGNKRTTTATAMVDQTDVAEFPAAEISKLCNKYVALFALLRDARDARAKAKDELNDFLNRW